MGEKEFRRQLQSPFTNTTHHLFLFSSRAEQFLHLYSMQNMHYGVIHVRTFNKEYRFSVKYTSKQLKHVL